MIRQSVIMAVMFSLCVFAVTAVAQEGEMPEEWMEGEGEWIDDIIDPVNVQICGCRFSQDESGNLSGRVCGCQVLQMNVSDLLLVGGAMAGLVVLSKRKR